MGGTKQPETTTQISKTELPKWVDKAGQENYASAVDLSNKPYVPYTGERVAGLDPQELAAQGTLSQGMGVTNSALQTALGAAGAGGSYTPQNVSMPGGVGDVSARTFLQGDVSKYMDPNLNNVVNTTLAGMDRSIAGAQQGVVDQARGAGAWGSSRQGVQQAVLAAEGAKAKASTEAGLRSAAYTDAAGRLQQDNASALQAALANQNSGLTTQGQTLQAQQANQSAGLAGAGLNLQAGQLANSVAGTAADTSGRNALLQSQLGGTSRALEQAKLDANYGNFMEQRDYPQEMLNMRLAALGMSPYGKSQSTQTTQPSNSSSSGLLTGIGAAATILPLLFSDPKTKKNKKKLGKIPGSKLNAYEFQYKDKFGGGPKQIGLMANDVEKKVPDAVHKVKVGGETVKAVDYGLAILKGGKRKSRSDKNKLRAPYRPRMAGGIGIGGR